MKTRVAVLLSALAVLAVLVATAFKQSDEAWVGFQKKYNELSTAKGATTQAPAVEPPAAPTDAPVAPAAPTTG